MTSYSTEASELKSLTVNSRDLKFRERLSDSRTSQKPSRMKTALKMRLQQAIRVFISFRENRLFSKSLM